MNHTPVLPVPLLVNIEGLKPSVSLKRINPATGVPFRHGDVRTGGHKFQGYGSLISKKTGFLYENWCSPESFEKIATQRAVYRAANVETIAAYRAKYCKANVEKIAAHGAKYRKTNVKKVAAYQAEYRKTNAETIAARNAKYWAANAETIAAQRAKYYVANVETIAAQRAKYYKSNVETIAAYKAKYAKANPGKINAKIARRRAAKLQRTPPWLTQEQRAEIEAIYVLCAERTKVTGIPHAVDHVLPLMGRNVSGLHVPWNLRIITASENCSKGNRVQE